MEVLFYVLLLDPTPSPAQGEGSRPYRPVQGCCRRGKWGVEGVGKGALRNNGSEIVRNLFTMTYEGYLLTENLNELFGDSLRMGSKEIERRVE